MKRIESEFLKLVIFEHVSLHMANKDIIRKIYGISNTEI